MKPTQRLAWLDALRGIAAVLVLISHIGGALSDTWFDWMLNRFNLGHVGVIIFFLVSGYIIPTSLEQTTLRQFWWRRVCRLYPLYWCAVLATALLTTAELLPTLANLTMLQSLVGIPDLDLVYWTLFVELTFYGLVSVLSITRLLHRTVPVFILLLLASLVGDVLVPAYTSFEPRIPVGYYLVLWCGTVLYRAQNRMISWRTASILFEVAFLVIEVPYLLGGRFEKTVAVAIFASIFLLRRAYWPQIFTWLGTISYSVYLLHPLILDTVPQIVNPILSILIWTALTVGLATATYNWIEMPAMRIGRRLAGSKKSINLPAAEGSANRGDTPAYTT